MFARLYFAGVLLASGPSFAEPTTLRMAQADNCPGLQHCTMMHALSKPPAKGPSSATLTPQSKGVCTCA